MSSGMALFMPPAAVMRSPVSPSLPPQRYGDVGVGPAQVERQRLQDTDGADFLPTMHQKPGHAAVLDDAVRPFGQLAPSVGFLAFLARHPGAPCRDCRRLAATAPAPLALGLGLDREALGFWRAIHPQFGLGFDEFDG